MDEITKIAIEVGAEDMINRPSSLKAQEVFHDKTFTMLLIAKYTGISVSRLKNLSSGRTPLDQLPEADLLKLAKFSDTCEIFRKLAEKIENSL